MSLLPEIGGAENRSKIIVIIKIAIIILMIEIVIMLALAVIPHKLGVGPEALVDAVFLVLLSTPFIYIFVVRPYVVASEQALTRISHLAYHDALTQLPNRRLFTKHLERCLASCKRHGVYSALLLVDLNGFKNINDQYGHDAGDALLVEMSRRLLLVTRAEDLACRQGGDEFLLLIQHLDAGLNDARTKVELVARKLQHLLSEPLVYKGYRLQVDASIGIRMLGPDKLDVEGVMRDADAAMYRAKKSSSENVYIFDEMAGTSDKKP